MAACRGFAMFGRFRVFIWIIDIIAYRLQCDSCATRYMAQISSSDRHFDKCCDAGTYWIIATALKRVNAHVHDALSLSGHPTRFRIICRLSRWRHRSVLQSRPRDVYGHVTYTTALVGRSRFNTVWWPFVSSCFWDATPTLWTLYGPTIGFQFPGPLVPCITTADFTTELQLSAFTQYRQESPLFLQSTGRLDRRSVEY